MKKITDDNGGGWYYAPAEEGKRDAYYFKDKDGKISGKIYAEYVPDPVHIWQEKCKFYEVDINSPKGKFLKPNPVVWNLHTHVNQVAEERRNAKSNK